MLDHLVVVFKLVRNVISFLVVFSTGLYLHCTPRSKGFNFIYTFALNWILQQRGKRRFSSTVECPNSANYVNPIRSVSSAEMSDLSLARARQLIIRF